MIAFFDKNRRYSAGATPGSYLLDHVRQENGQKRVGKVAGEAENHLDQYAAAFEILGQNRVGGRTKQTGADAEEQRVGDQQLAGQRGERCEQKTFGGKRLEERSNIQGIRFGLCYCY